MVECNGMIESMHSIKACPSAIRLTRRLKRKEETIGSLESKCPRDGHMDVPIS